MRLIPLSLVDRKLEDGTVVRELAPEAHEYIVPSLKGLTPFSVSRFMSRAQADEVEKALSAQLKRDVIVVSDNIVMLRVEEIASADVARLLPGGGKP